MNLLQLDKKAILGGKKKPIELWNKVINHAIIEIFVTKTSDTINIYDFKRPIVDGNKRDIKCTTTQVKDKQILFTA